MAESCGDINGKEVFTSFTLDSISTCGLGVEANSFKDPGNEYRWCDI